MDPRQAPVGAVPCLPLLRLDLDAPRLGEVLRLPPLVAVSHPVICCWDLDSVPLENLIDLKSIQILEKKIQGSDMTLLCVDPMCLVRHFLSL